MGMNGPVRAVRGERLYPITAMGSHTAGGIVNVEGWCRDHNMTSVAFMTDADGNVDLCPGGQDANHHYVIFVQGGAIYDISVKQIHQATTAVGVFILGINP